ncbi:MAG TPA: MATE family efflux transporter [Polyangiaceae bacterium]|jgi:MATE family multidrug resistance protein|nr:MATE family efflux transporter [Polyangiaceae bacterium]
METVDLAAPLVHERDRYAAILRLALPTVVAMLSQSVVNEIDVVFFSHLPCPESSNGQAALLPSLILVWLFGGSLSALSVGTQAIVARRYAEGDRPAAGAVLTNAAFFCLVAGAAFSVIGIVCLPWLVKTMIGVPEVQAVALDYTRWRLLGVVSMAATMAIKAFFDGLGKTHVHLVAAIIMNVANVILCWMLIFGHAGAPRMGAPGAGLSAFIATWIGLAIMIGYAALVRSEYHPLRLGNLSRRLTSSILSLSVPAAAATVIMMVGFGLFARTAGQLDARAAASSGAAVGRCGGVEAVNSAANTDIVETLKLTFTACIAFGTATATLIGQSLGRRRPDEAQRWGWASVRLGVVLFGVVGLCEGVLFTEQIVAFLSNSPAVRAAAIFPMRIMGIVTPIIAVALILSEGLFGAGSTRFVAVAQLILVFGWLVPGAYVLGVVLHLGLNGIWMAAFGYACLAAAVMSTKFAGGSWKKIKL